MILGGITAISLIIWFVPYNDTNLVISDYVNELESIRDRHGVIEKEIDNNLSGLSNGTISPDDFILRAQISSSQINSLIIEIIQSNPPAQWQESYLNYEDSLKSYNNYLLESIVYANKMKSGSPNDDLKDEIGKLDELKMESDSFALKSNETKP